jgi:hypothetical protein
MQHLPRREETPEGVESDLIFPKKADDYIPQRKHSAHVPARILIVSVPEAWNWVRSAAPRRSLNHCSTAPCVAIRCQRMRCLSVGGYPGVATS